LEAIIITHKIMKATDIKNKQNHFPRIGMRIIKSAIGVFLCFLIDYFRGGSGIVFYSLLAVLWCIRDYVSETKKFAFQRTVGTVIGAVYGLIFLVGNRMIIDCGLSLESGTTFVGSILYGLVVALFIIALLYTTVVFGQKQASYFSCVVFLSIIINHASDINPYLFVWNRFLDTMIGIIVGVGVNCVSLHRNRNLNTLFLSGLDDTILSPGGEISAYSRVELNRMIESGVKFTVSTIRTPASLLEPMRGINLTLPAITMDGAALYNIAENSYEKVYIISNEQSAKIQDFLSSRGIDFFANVVIEDVLLIYYRDSENPHYNAIMDKMKKSPYRNYLKMDGVITQNVVYYMIIDTADRIEEIRKIIAAESLFDDLRVTVTKSFNMEGCSLIKIYNKNASKENMLDYLKDRLGIEETVTFGTIEGKYTYTVAPGEFNSVVKLMKKEVHKE